MSMRSAAKYILDGGVDAVDGWLGGGAITATLAINDWQRRHDVSGNVAEIGIHHGKFFLVLKNLCRDDECSIAVDVFDDQELNVDRSGRGDRAIFESNLAAHSDGKNVEIIQGDSKLLTPDRILEAGRDKQIRLFSVDGSHTTEYTLSDLLLASDVLDDNGVIALDDFYSQYWPGVQEGFHHFMSKMSPEFKALAIGNNKLFICKRAAHSELLKIFKESLYPYYLDYKDVTVWGSDAVSMALPEPKAVFSSDLLLPTNVFALSAGRCSPRCDLRHGWSHFEADGTWTIGKQASVDTAIGRSSDLRASNARNKARPLHPRPPKGQTDRRLCQQRAYCNEATQQYPGGMDRPAHRRSDPHRKNDDSHRDRRAREAERNRSILRSAEHRRQSRHDKALVSVRICRIAQRVRTRLTAASLEPSTLLADRVENIPSCRRDGAESLSRSFNLGPVAAGQAKELVAGVGVRH